MSNSTIRPYGMVPYEKMDGVMWNVYREVPHGCLISFFAEVNMASAERLRAARQAAGMTKPSYTALVARAVALALRDHPCANRCIFEWPFVRRAVQFKDADVTVGVDRNSANGMHASPETLRSADRMTLDGIVAALKSFGDPANAAAQRWGAFKRMVDRLPEFLSRFLTGLPGRFPSLWLKHRGSPVLITSPAKYGIDAVCGQWNWPVTISFGVVRPRPVAVRNQVVVCPTTILSMVFDKRIMVGAPAARFMQRIVQLLEDAENAIEDAPAIKANPTRHLVPVAGQRMSRVAVAQ